MASYYCKTCDHQSEADCYEDTLRNIDNHFDSFYDLETHFDVGWDIYDDRQAASALRFLFDHLTHEVVIVGSEINPPIPVAKVY